MTAQTMSGPLARLVAGRLQQWLQRELDTWLQLLKLEAEARARVDDTHAATGGSLLVTFGTKGSSGRVS